MARKLKNEVGVSFNDAFRLIRTESAFIQAEADQQTYLEAAEDLGLKYYKYDAFLDSRTSQICRELDGKIFRIADMEVGVNFPPMHPNCRSTTQLILDDDEIKGKKIEGKGEKPTKPTTNEKKEKKEITRVIGNYAYTVENNGFNEYRVIKKRNADGFKD